MQGLIESFENANISDALAEEDVYFGSDVAVVAPTGTAAALVGGHTIESFLEQGFGGSLSSVKIDVVNKKLCQTRWLFIEEV